MQISEVKMTMNEQLKTLMSNGHNANSSGSKRRWREFTKNPFARNRDASCKSNSNTNLTATTKKSGSASPTPLCANQDFGDIVRNLDQKGLNILQLLALTSLELSAPASDLLLKGSSSSPALNNCQKRWVQCSGHQGAFAPAAPGTIWKKVATTDDFEVKAYIALQKDEVMRDAVPKYFGDIRYKDEVFIEMEDLLHKFGSKPSIMDIKMGTRTFLESEVSNGKPRADLYQKLMKIDSAAPTVEEHEAAAITKLRYMQIREALSSSSNLGFRIEGTSPELKLAHHVTDFTLIKDRQDTESVFVEFLRNNSIMRSEVVDQLKNIRRKFEISAFFARHEVIGSSLLIVHDGQQVGVWMIDFAKTVPLPDGFVIDHKSTWSLGNHEDGYLLGLNNLIDILETISLKE
jgi:1D-myo-inositol-triphosphate 3-kinase